MRSLLTKALLCLLGFALLTSPAEARKRRSLPTWEWGLDFSASAIYNDNLIGLSERDQNKFRRNAATFPTPLETVDDLENELQVHPSFRWRAPMTLMLDADYRLKFVTRTRNSFTNYQTHTFSVAVRPRVAGYRWQAKARVFTIPSFYLRDYRDRDYAEYHATRFSNRDYKASLRYRFYEPLWFEAGAAFGSYYYNAKFTEYDSEYRDLSLGLAYLTPWRVELSGGYTRRLSENIGKDQKGALGTPLDPTLLDDAEYGDGDFNEDEFNLAASMPLTFVKPLPLDASLSYRLRRRVYTTDRALELDPFHRGRLDRRGRVTASVQARITPALSADTFFSYEARGTESQVASVPLAKDFHRREFGLALTYKIR